MTKKCTYWYINDVRHCVHNIVLVKLVLTAMKSFLLISLLGETISFSFDKNFFLVLVECHQQTTKLEATYRQLNEEKMIVHVESTDINYLLHTNGSFPEMIILNKSQNLNENSTVKMIIHGFKEHNNVSWYRNMIKEYLPKDNHKVIAIDWSKWSKKFYIEAVASTYSVGIHIGNFIRDLMKNYNLNLQNIHIIGHSLGAHVAGFAGDHFYKLTKTKISRITGLDPAGPLFEIPINNNNNWLDKGDAQFVDNIHTDAGYFGFKHPTGHADFYPNGGLAIQPGCEITQFFNIQECK